MLMRSERLHLSRRTLLTAAAALGLGLVGPLAGCTQRPSTAVPAPEPDELAIDRAVASARQLRAGLLLRAQSHHDLAPLLNRLAAVHEEHLRALGAAPAATPSPAPTAAVQTPAQLQRAEWAAARTAMRDGEAAAPVFAVLLARIAAARASNSDLISAAAGRRPSGALSPASPSPVPTRTSTPSASATVAAPAQTSESPDPAALNTINRLLAGQHAAVFVYPLIVARARGRSRTLARTLWQAHQDERDRLEGTLLAAGAQPVAAEPAYDVGTAPTSTARAAALAARVERGLAALAADVIAASQGAARDLGFDQLVLAARRTAGWTGRSEAFPGLTAQPTPTSTSSPTSTPSG